MFQSVCCVLSVLLESQGRKPCHGRPEPRRCCSPQAASTLKAVPLRLDLPALVLMYRAHTARPSLGHFIVKLLNSIQGQYRIMPLIPRVVAKCPAVDGVHEQRQGAVCGGAEGLVTSSGRTVSPERVSTGTPTEARRLCRTNCFTGEDVAPFSPASQREELTGL